MQRNDGRSRDQIANWFQVPVNRVKPLSGRGAFISYVRYLTHEDPHQQALGKYRYADSKLVANFDWRSEVNEHFAKALKIPSRLDEVKIAVLQGSLTPWEIRGAEPLLYATNSLVLKRLAEDCRMAHIHAGLETPALQDMKLRINAGVTLADALTWIADRLNLQGNSYDRKVYRAAVLRTEDGPGIGYPPEPEPESERLEAVNLRTALGDSGVTAGDLQSYSGAHDLEHGLWALRAP